MADWKHTLNLLPEWDQAKEGEIPINKLSEVVAKRLASLNIRGHIADERDEIVEEFKMLANDPVASTDDFDDVMHMLYDFADTQLDNKWPPAKLIWVKTF